MSSKTTTNTQNQYNQAGMGNYNRFQTTLGNTLNSFINNPLGNSYFNQQLSQEQNQASQIGQRNISNSLHNLRTGGGLLGNSASYIQNLVNKAKIANSGMQAGAFNSTLNTALNNRNMALAGMEAYTPLQTGANTTQTQSQGWGSILGSVAGIGLSMAMPGIGGMLGGGSFASGYRGSSGGGGGPLNYNALLGRGL